MFIFYKNVNMIIFFLDYFFVPIRMLSRKIYGVYSMFSEEKSTREKRNEQFTIKLFSFSDICENQCLLLSKLPKRLLRTIIRWSFDNCSARFFAGNNQALSSFYVGFVPVLFGYLHIVGSIKSQTSGILEGKRTSFEQTCDRQEPYLGVVEWDFQSR